MALGKLSVVSGEVTNAAAIQAAPTGAGADNLYCIHNTSNSAVYVLVNINGAYSNASIYNVGDHTGGGSHREFVDNLVTSASASTNVTSGWIQPGETVVLRATLTSADSRVQCGPNTIKVKHNSNSAVGDRVFVNTGGVYS